MGLPPAEEAFNAAACKLRALGYPDAALRAMLDGVDDAFRKAPPEVLTALRARATLVEGGGR